jgi:hypothetical protein
MAFSAAFGGALAMGLGLRGGNRVSDDELARPPARVAAITQTGRRTGLIGQVGAAVAVAATTLLLKALEDAALRLVTGRRKPE